MNELNLKRLLNIAVLLCIALASALTYTVVHRDGHAHAQDSSEPVVAAGPSPANPPGSGAPANATNQASLAPVQLTPQRLQEIGVTTATAEIKEIGSELQVPGSVAMDEERLSYVQTRFGGWIRSVYANATYQYVRKGQRLFTIYSPDLVSTEQEYLLARQNRNTTTEHMHGTAANESDWLLQAAEERLRRFDVPSSVLSAMKESGTPQREIPVESPVSGFIVERNALPNAYVQPDTKLYTIADLSTVWVYANVFQTDLSRLKPGDPGDVTVDAYPGRAFHGRIEQILPDLDASTRTARVRFAFSNSGLLLKPGMYVTVKISAPLGRQLVIPASGVLQSGNRQIAFLDRGQGSLEPHEIETGPRIDDSVVVLKGLKPGDRIVSSANFLVDSEAQLQGAMGGFAPQSQAEGAQPSPAEQIRIDFATLPSPPHRGMNGIRVTVAGADGKPTSGAQVSATFSMAAMPAMGMPAMRVTSSLAEKSSGAYEGTAQLDSGGTWEVTINVSRNGRMVATKRLSVNATGGMA